MHLKKKRYMYEERDDYSSVDNNSNTNSSSSGSNSSSSKQVICQKNCTLSNMADNTREVRIEEQLKVKIGEAKNLVSRNAANSSCSTQGFRDVYCTIALDQEEICRTPTKERTLSPFFGEEFQFKIPRRFRYLSVYVYDRDRHMKQDKPIGKIAIKREELYNYNHNDHWFPLRPVNPNSEVQGMAHIQVEFEEVHHQHPHHHHHSPASVQHMQQQHHSLHHHPPHNCTPGGGAHHDTHHPRINLIRPVEFERNSDMILDYTPHQHQAQHNDYKENSELSSIQRGLLKNNRTGTGGVGGGIGGGGTMSSSGSGSLLLRASASAEQNWKNVMGPPVKHSRVAIRVLECVDLAKKSGTCDPYVEFTAHYTNMRPITKRTKTRKKTVNPEFDEVMHFDLTIDADPSAHASSGGAVPAPSKGVDDPAASPASASLGGSVGSGHSPAGNKGYSVYPLGGVDLCEITVTLWHDAPGIAEKVFLGEVKIPMRNKQQQAAVQPSAWYFLQPRPTDSAGRALGATPRSCATPPGTRLSCDSTIGSLRLKLLYTADHVFPLATYDDLMNLLLESADQRPITVSAVSILGELVSCKTDVAQPLVRLFMHTGRIAPIIKALADHEISNLTDPTTIFRGNTLVSKMMDETMRLSGLHYLHQTLRPVMAQILAEKKPCEIDPSKVKDRSAVDTNLHHLQDYVERVFEAITKSAVRCPRVLCHIFHDLRECAARHFPRNREVRYSVVSGFIFLRFFAPAILGPKLFDLTTEPLDCQTNRTLTLISKTIQSLGNLVSSRSSQQPCKEEYTGQLYLKFCTEKHVEAVKHFLEVISTTPNDDGRQHHGDANSLMPVAEGQLEPVLLKEGMMTKWPQSRKRFGRRQFKHRYFRLTTHSLSYAKSKGKQPICDIPLSDIERVEQLNEKNFKRQNCFKIVRKDRSVIVQTTNCVEEREWIDLLHKICLTNSIRMQYFHPSAFVNGVYSCCARSDENAPGCKNVSAEAMDYFQMDLVTALDPALDLQRIHTLIMSHMNYLKEMLEPMAFHQHQQMVGGGGMNTSSSNNNSHYHHNPLMAMALAFQQHSPKAFNDFQATIQQLRQVALVIDKDHRDYKEGIARELKYGSRQAPIGDDNYLHMMRAAGHLNYQQQHQQQQQQQHLLQQHHQQPQQQQQSQTQQQILPQMQLVMAYPYQPLQQQQMLKAAAAAAAGQQDGPQPQQHHSNMNAYFMHSLRSQQRSSQQQQQYQQAQQQHLLRASATVHSASNSITTANAVVGNPSG